VDHLLIIPARFASSRFPGKPLADLSGKTVLQRVHERCLEAVAPDRVVIATDDDRIEAHCREIGANVERTSVDCLTGTDRVAEVASRRPADWYVNVQGDEPFVDPAAIRAVVAAAKTTDCPVVNAMAVITEESEFRSPTVPKVVARPDLRLLYMSRAPIPTTKDHGFVAAHRQVGLYAFTREVLAEVAGQSSKSPLEQIEDIEILRYLEAGHPVQMVVVDAPGIAVDTPEDLERARAALAR
jgi:3-deoxy-manno-octulosonate cytidylyltransferase (CMP-KDO synthetase)